MQRYNAIDFLSRFMSTSEENPVELLDVLNPLPALSKEGPWIAGGAIRRTLIMDELKSDFDFFFRDEMQLAEFRKEIIKMGAKNTIKTEHSETYLLNIASKERFLQLIKIGFYSSAEELIDTFDFTITQCAYDGTDFIFGDFTLWDLARKRLALHKLTFGVATMKRLLKYTKQGFTSCTGTMQSILNAVIDNPSVVRSNVEYVD